MGDKYAKQKARRAANLAAGLRYDGKPRGVPYPSGPIRDHAAEVEAGLALGLDLDGIAADMGLRPGSLVRALERKGRVDLMRRLGVQAATRR